MAFPRLMLIAGIPSSGKTYFGDWLETSHGFLHIDDVSGSRLRLYGLDQAWEESLRSRDAHPFVAELHKLERPAVLNWGFPADCLGYLGLLKHAGLALWWFDADIQAARREHVRIGKNAQAFDAQVAAIAAHRVQIDTLFSPHVLQVISRHGERLPPEVILEVMSRAA